MTMFRAADIGDFTGRTLDGRAYRYDRPSRVTDTNWARGDNGYYEEIVTGADAKTLRDHVAFPVDKQHNRSAVGTVVFNRSDSGRELLFTAEIDHSPEGDQVLAEIESWSDVSVAFDALRNAQRSTPQHGVIVQRAEIRLNSLALAAPGTALHSGAEVLHLRAATTPRLTAVRKRLILL